MSEQMPMKVLVLALALSLPAGFALAADAMKGSSSDKSSATDKKSSKLPSDDEKFIKDAAQGGMMEVELGKLAQGKASNDKVKEFGKRMEQDHGKANDELKKLASDKGVELTSTLDSKHKSKVDKLSKVSGADFDRRYIDEMVSDHKTDVKEFQKQADKGKDADVKQFASKHLPTLKEHLQLAETTQKELKQAKGKNTASLGDKVSDKMGMSQSSSDKSSNR